MTMRDGLGSALRWWLGSLVVVGAAAAFKLFWDIGLCMDDGAADNGSRSAQHFCAGWQSPDRYGAVTWLLPFATILAGGALAVASRRRRAVLAVGGAALVVQCVLLGLSLAAR
jgi:hypothetical protein